MERLISRALVVIQKRFSSGWKSSLYDSWLVVFVENQMYTGWFLVGRWPHVTKSPSPPHLLADSLYRKDRENNHTKRLRHIGRTVVRCSHTAVTFVLLALCTKKGFQSPGLSAWHLLLFNTECTFQTVVQACTQWKCSVIFNVNVGVCTPWSVWYIHV